MPTVNNGAAPTPIRMLPMKKNANANEFVEVHSEEKSTPASHDSSRALAFDPTW